MGPQPANPLMRILMGVFAVLLLMASFFIGAVVFLVMIGLAFMLSLVTLARVWWLRRRMIRQARSGAAGPPPESTSVRREIHIIEGRYERED